jgi:hypothetical protein
MPKAGPSRERALGHGSARLWAYGHDSAKGHTPAPADLKGRSGASPYQGAPYQVLNWLTTA